MPLAKPILATLVVMNMISLYGDFIWPLLVIDSNSKQVISVAVQTYSSSTGITDYGAMIAGFVMATIPLLIMFMFSSQTVHRGHHLGRGQGLIPSSQQALSPLRLHIRAGERLFCALFS